MTPRLWLPSRIASQIAILVIGAVVLLQVLMAGALFLLAPRPHRGPPELAPVAAVLRLSAAAPAGLRPQILDAANVAEPSFRFMLASGKVIDLVAPDPALGWRASRLLGRYAAELLD